MYLWAEYSAFSNMTVIYPVIYYTLDLWVDQEAVATKWRSLNPTLTRRRAPVSSLRGLHPLLRRQHVHEGPDADHHAHGGRGRVSALPLPESLRPPHGHHLPRLGRHPEAGAGRGSCQTDGQPRYCIPHVPLSPVVCLRSSTSTQRLRPLVSTRLPLLFSAVVLIVSYDFTILQWSSPDAFRDCMCFFTRIIMTSLLNTTLSCTASLRGCLPSVEFQW